MDIAEPDASTSDTSSADDDTDPFLKYTSRQRHTWPLWKKLLFVGCICVWMCIVVLIVTIIFLVRTPNVQVGNVNVSCTNYLTCLQSGIPLSVLAQIDNDNIIGGDISGPVYLYTSQGFALSQGYINSTFISARAVTALPVDFVIMASATTTQLAIQLLVEKKNFTVNVTADIQLKIAAITTQLVYNTTYVLTPGDLPISTAKAFELEGIVPRGTTQEFTKQMMLWQHEREEREDEDEARRLNNNRLQRQTKWRWWQ